MTHDKSKRGALDHGRMKPKHDEVRGWTMRAGRVLLYIDNDVPDDDKLRRSLPRRHKSAS